MLTLLLTITATFTESVKAKIKIVGGGLFEDAEADEACVSKSGILGLISFFFFLQYHFNSYLVLLLFVLAIWC